MRFTRAIVIVLDSAGIGELPDAALFGDEGANTLGNIASTLGGLNLPNLEKLGLGNIVPIMGVPPQQYPVACFGKLAEVSPGKDTTTGHWELMGIEMSQGFPVYPDGFPISLLEEFSKLTGRGWLGNKAASGTEIIEELGDEHIRTGKLIIYTSADSVFQIAAHEEVIRIPELYAICQKARELLMGENEVSRVIARPFIGTTGNFTRTSNRHDYVIDPPIESLLDLVKRSGKMVYAIGKIKDIFNGHGITESVHTTSNLDGIEKTIQVIQDENKAGIIFTNLVDFDAKYGHRNNPEGYAAALREFDDYLPAIIQIMSKDDILFITSDHGTDPTLPSTDHTREYVPLLAYGKKIQHGKNIGIRKSFADLGATIAEILAVPSPKFGRSFHDLIIKSVSD